MLVLKRKRGQSIKIGPNISIIVLYAADDSVRLGVKVWDGGKVSVAVAVLLGVYVMVGVLVAVGVLV